MTHETTPTAVEGDVNTSEPGRQARRNRPLPARPVLDRDDTGFLHQCLSTPCLDEVVSAEGIFLWMRDGRRVMDFHGNGVHNVGFAHPRVIAAVEQQIRSLPFCTRRFTNEPIVRLAERLGQATDGQLTKALFAPGGTLAISTAIKLARVATGRETIVGMDGAFHGASMDAISVGGQSLFRESVGPAMPGTEHIPPPRHDPSGHVFQPELDESLSALRRALVNAPVAAVLAEPVRWTTCHVPARGYWPEVRRLCDQHGALLIFDEIGSGLGRTGRMFAYQHFDVQPDMICLGKSLGGAALPLAAVLTRPELDVAGHLALGHYTHEKSPLGAAAGLAVLDAIANEDLLTHVNQVGRAALERLDAIRMRYARQGQSRALGFMLALELDDRPGQPSALRAQRVMYEGLARGVNFKVTDQRTLTLTPPLVTSHAQMNEALDIVEASLHHVDGC